MALDPAAREFLAAAGKLPQPYEMPLAEFRALAERLVGTGDPEPVARVEHRCVSGGDGQPLRLRLYLPDGERPAPLVVWAHGGSFTRGSLDVFDAARRAFANAAGCVVVAVDQRLSPEARYPAPVADVHAALRWAVRHATEFGGHPSLVGVAGESSGGNLAAAVTLLARSGSRPAPAFQILFTPLLDATLGTPSAAEYAEGYVLTRQQLLWCYDQYAPGTARTEPGLSPLHEPDLAGLPPAVVVTAEYDPVRDEGERYADRLAAAGVPVVRRRLEGMVHHYPGPTAMRTTARLTRDLLATLPARVEAVRYGGH